MAVKHVKCNCICVEHTLQLLISRSIFMNSQNQLKPTDDNANGDEISKESTEDKDG